MTRARHVDNGSLETTWPYTRSHFERLMAGHAEVTYVNVSKTDFATLDWTTFDAVVLLGGDLDAGILDDAPRLAAVGGMTDGRGPSCFDLLCTKNIPYIDATAAWAQSVAECGIGIILSARRRFPHWHHRIVAMTRWPNAAPVVHRSVNGSRRPQCRAQYRRSPSHHMYP